MTPMPLEGGIDRIAWDQAIEHGKRHGDLSGWDGNILVAGKLRGYRALRHGRKLVYISGRSDLSGLSKLEAAIYRILEYRWG